jgi:hypothetical protein
VRDANGMGNGRIRALRLPLAILVDQHFGTFNMP